MNFSPLWLGIFPFIWWFLFVPSGLFCVAWTYELPCKDKLPEFYCIHILGFIRFFLVLYPLGLELDKALFGLEFCHRWSHKVFIRQVLFIEMVVLVESHANE